MKASFRKHTLIFKRPGGTSRGIMKERDTWFLILQDKDAFGLGECAMLKGLSSDDRPTYEKKLEEVCQDISHKGPESISDLTEYPSIRFGLETALLSLKSTDPFTLFPSKFTSGEAAIPINGLIWMGKPDFMRQQIRKKIKAGYMCLKLKIGAIDFEEEMRILMEIRNEFGPEECEIRVDANGAFTELDALQKLERLAKLGIHSIEQPIKPGQWEVLKQLCEQSPLPIALDEELIGLDPDTQGDDLLRFVKPEFLILKPTLVGGFQGSGSWISLARENGIGWWVTSALESNVGLNAIAQWTYSLGVDMPQGLGTGGLFTNNIESPLMAEGGFLRYEHKQNWSHNLISE